MKISVGKQNITKLAIIILPDTYKTLAVVKMKNPPAYEDKWKERAIEKARKEGKRTRKQA